MNITQEQRDKQLERFDAYLAERASQNTLLERNRAKQKKHAIDNAETKGFREGMKRKFGFDPVTDVDRFPVMKEGFSWGKFRGQLESQLKEADSSTAFTQFLVAGLLQNVIGMYTTVKTSYQEWVHVTSTNLLDTPVAPLHGLSFPREVGEQMPYPVSYTAALSLKFHARKYGTMYEVTKELLEDDQSGQFKQQTGALGEYLQMLTEVLCYGRLASVKASQYSGFSPGVSETMPSGETATSWPWCASNGGTNSAGLIGGGYNTGTSKVALNDANAKIAFNVLAQQKNLLGILMNVKPNRFLISPYYQWDIAILLNSAYYPAGAQAAGVTGGAFAINPLKGIADATIAPYMGDSTGNFANLSKAWYLIDDSKPWFQLVQRTPVAVEQENPLSGQSFERDVCRFKANTRQIADFVDSRFAYQGSDGSV
jgi:hypothetical protein